jgi:hypothetical protein
VGILDRFEKKLEGVVNGAFAKAFRANVEPVEIASHLERELDQSAAIVTRGRTIVPNDFHVELSTTDFDRLVAMNVSLASEFADVVRKHAEQQRYSFTGPVRVELEQNDELATGVFRLRGDVAANVSTFSGHQPTPKAVEHATAFLDVNGTRHPINAPGLLIGRGQDCDLRIDDPGVSRRHAEVRVSFDTGVPVLTVVDLGSTNGIKVGGQKVDTAVVGPGSRITIGNTTMTVVLGER